MRSRREIGEVVGGYRLEALLGQGGMGCVYRASHLKLGRTVAIKILHRRYAEDDELVTRFLREARIVNDTRHPNLVDITDFIEVDEPRCIAYVMEYLQGPLLSDLISKNAVGVQQALNVCLQLASALEAVHAIGVIHRDLKPNNIIVIGSLEGDLVEVPSAKILDFGIAKIEQGAQETRTGWVLGTPRYMAPEQVVGGVVSAYTDIYALGAILFEMIMHRPLFEGPEKDVLQAKVKGRVPDPAMLIDRGGPREIVEIIRAAVEEAPERRPSIQEFAACLTRALASVKASGEAPMEPTRTMFFEQQLPPPKVAVTETVSPPNLTEPRMLVQTPTLPPLVGVRWMLLGGLTLMALSAAVLIALLIEHVSREPDSVNVIPVPQPSVREIPIETPAAQPSMAADQVEPDEQPHSAPARERGTHAKPHRRRWSGKGPLREDDVRGW